METPKYKWIYQRTTVSQQRKQKLHSSYREKKEGTSIWNAWVLLVFVLLHDSNFIMETEDAYRGSSTIPPSSKLELLCQYEMTSIVTKSSIIDDLGIRDPPLYFVCFLCKTLPKILKLYEVNIYMIKVKKKGTRSSCEIYPELTIKAPIWR